MKCKTYFRAFVVILCAGIASADEKSEEDTRQRSGDSSAKQRTVDDFVRQLTSFFGPSLFANALNPALRSKNGDQRQNFQPPQTPFPTYGLGQRPSPSDSFAGYPPLQQGPLRPPLPGSYPLLTRPLLGGNFPPSIHRPYPGGQLPYGGNYPQGSLFAALDSISRYDDLRCVPRLLCEVTTGSSPSKSGRPYYPPQNNADDVSPVPFLSRDALIALLTILNFVDDSPLLSFARAAFLGYSSRGDARACLTAYPTCPRDPNQLIDYLNNHNGGFFRFFNQQLQQQPQYAPQYQHFIQKYQQQQQQQQQQNDPTAGQTEAFTRRYTDAGHSHNQHSRILNDPVDIEYIGNRPSNVLTQQQQQQQQQQQALFLQQLRQQNKLIFYNKDQMVQAQLVRESFRQEHEPHQVDTSRKGKKFAFPEQLKEGGGGGGSSYGMVFPDKTGTGNLVISGDADGNYKILYKDESFPNRIRTSRIRFQASDQQRSKRKIIFPHEEKM